MRVLLIFTAIAAVLTVIQTFITFVLLRRRRPFAAGLREQAIPTTWKGSRPDGSITPRVSILKPMSGLDDGLLDNLRSFAALSGVSYEVILSIADPRDQAVAVAQHAVREFPDVFRLVVGGGNEFGPVMNPKVERLIAAARVARGDLFFISDSNVRVSAGDMVQTIAAFDDPATGCVSNLFVGDGAETLGAAIESLHLLTFVMPGSTLAASVDVPCVVGKSMIIRRDVHDAIGGFRRFANVLAEDQAIGLAVRDAGFRVVVAPVVVRNFMARRALAGAMARQIRWNKIRYSFSPLIYSGELLLNPLPIALLTLDPLTVAAVALMRLAEAWVLARASGSSLTISQLLLTPLQDCVQFSAQFAPYFSNEVNWRGHRARLTRGTVMVPLEELPAAA